VVYAERMRENLERSRGVVFSGTVLLELARRGVSREHAYEWVQRNAMRSFHEETDFKRLLLADPDVTRVLTPSEIERAFNLDDQLRNVDRIFERVFLEGGARKREDVGIGAPNESEAWQALGVGPQRKGKKD
jgi:adenylosuccinate lyase